MMASRFEILLILQSEIDWYMETQNIEYKESWRDEYLKWICGFANAQGGTLYIGKNDKGEVVGVTDAKRLLEDIPNKVKNALGIVVDVQLLEQEGKPFLKIDVAPSSYPINFRGEYHIRSGATKQVLQGSALTHFLLKRTGMKWDAVAAEKFTAQDLDIESFNIFRREALRNKRMTKEDLDCSNEELLEKLNLTVDGKLKRAAVLLFHRNPEKMITGCYTKIGMFNKEADILYMDEVHGSLMLQADRVLDLLYQKYLKAFITYENVTRVETYPFPKMAVREAIFNALVHSDWSASCPIQIRVEDDLMYISNDCVLEEGLTAEKLMSPHKSQQLNPDIANTFSVPDSLRHGDVVLKKCAKRARTTVLRCHPIHLDAMTSWCVLMPPRPFYYSSRKKGGNTRFHELPVTIK